MKNISITCSYDDLCPVSEIVPFQGKIKKRKPKQLERIISSIEQYGFSFPFFVWRNQGKKFCIDGHGRLLALAEMSKRGYTIPPLPVVYIEAQNEKEARRKLIEVNNINGTFNKNAFTSFVADFAETLDFETMFIPTLDLSGIPDMFKVDIQDTSVHDAFDDLQTVDAPVDVSVRETVVEPVKETINPQGHVLGVTSIPDIGDSRVIMCPHCDHTFTV
jgi:hypothetical protein